MAGIVRRIDDLGRVPIPKEIRKELKIEEGDALEIYIENGKIVLEKYQNEEEYTCVDCDCKVTTYAEVIDEEKKTCVCNTCDSYNKYIRG